MIYYAWLGYYESFYRLGIFLVPLVLLIALLLALIAFFKNNKSYRSARTTFMVSSTILFSALIITHKIEHYKPTLAVKIPAEFEGTVYLFPSDTIIGSDVIINEKGIGYLPRRGQYNFKYKHGNKRIDNIKNTASSNIIQYWSADSSKIEVVYVTCMDVVKEKEYPKTELGWIYKECMTKEKFENYLRSGWVDADTIHFKSIVITE